MNFINKPDDIDIYSRKFFLGKSYLTNQLIESCIYHDISLHDDINVSPDGIVLSLHNKTIVDLEIPDSIIIEDKLVNIVGIGYNSFINSPIKTIKFNNIIHIESYAFAFSKLTNIVFNEKLETIGNNSFRNCSCLQRITFNKIKHVGYNAFFMCTSLESIIFINYNNKIKIKFEEDAFAFCPNLRIIIFTEDDNINHNHSDINLENIYIFYKKNNKWVRMKHDNHNMNDIIQKIDSSSAINQSNDDKQNNVLMKNKALLSAPPIINNVPTIVNNAPTTIINSNQKFKSSHIQTPINNEKQLPNITTSNKAIDSEKKELISYKMIIIVIIVIIVIYLLIKK